MDEHDSTGSVENRGNRKFVVLEIEDETPDFSKMKENVGGFSDVRTEMASDDPIFGFEITKDFWQQGDAEPAETEQAAEGDGCTDATDVVPEREAPPVLFEKPEDNAPIETETAYSEIPAEDMAEQGKKVESFGDFRVEVQPELFFDFTQSDEDEPDYIPPEETQSTGRKILRGIASWTLTVLVAFVLALIINIFIFRPSEVSGDSMVPTLHNTDTVVLSRVPYMFSEPKHGDIVVIDCHVNEKRNLFSLFGEALKYNVITKLCGQEEPDYFWIKRVIGTAGDEISFSDDHIYRNGERLEEDYINESFIYSYPNGTSVTVPEGYVYVMGDNRNHSTDSRVIGIVPLENIIGKMIVSW